MLRLVRSGMGVSYPSACNLPVAELNWKAVCVERRTYRLEGGKGREALPILTHCKNLLERRMVPQRVHKTIQDVPYSILKAALSSILCVYQVRFCFCYHYIGWLIEQPYGLMIDFCSDPSPTSSGLREALLKQMKLSEASC